MDALNRAVNQAYMDGTRATFTFDSASRQQTMQDVSGIATLSWDNANRQIGALNGAGRALTYTLDPNGNRTVMQDPDGGLTSYSWDAENRMQSLVNPWNELTTIAYDPLSRELRKILANGVSVSHLYDPNSRETLLSNISAAGIGLAIFTASYDPVGNRSSLQELDGVRVTYAYDPSYQLINEQRSGVNAHNTTYSYDPVGNRTQKNDSGALTTALYNQTNEITSLQPPTSQPTTSLWDASGNLSVENAGGQLTSFMWDPENRMTGVAYPAGAPDTMTYSNDGLRQKKVSGSTTSQFVWDNQNLLQEKDQAGVTQAQYSDYPGYWGGLVSQRRGANSSFFGFDMQANTRLLSNPAGAVSDQFSYKAFGEELSASGTTTEPFRFGGMYGYYRDLAARLYVRAREYEPFIGRWMSRDPLGFGGGDSELYLFSNNDPMQWGDPSGLRAKRNSRGENPRCREKNPAHEPDYPKWKNCISGCVNKWCKKGSPDLENWVWCIIKGEGEWNPNCVTCTQLKRSGLRVCALGLMQVMPYYHEEDCRKAGYADYRTNPCSNIGCGVKLLCDCLSPRHFHIKACGWLYDSINKRSFDRCIRSQHP